MKVLEWEVLPEFFLVIFPDFVGRPLVEGTVGKQFSFSWDFHCFCSYFALSFACAFVPRKIRFFCRPCGFYSVLLDISRSDFCRCVLSRVVFFCCFSAGTPVCFSRQIFFIQSRALSVFFSEGAWGRVLDRNSGFWWRIFAWKGHCLLLPETGGAKFSLS